MARPLCESQHLIFTEQILRIEKRAQKLIKRKNYSSRNRNHLQNVTGIISGLLADYARDQEALNYLLDCVETNKDDYELKLKVYRMSAVSRGRCLIINNMHFMDQENHSQFGSEIDALNIAGVFRKLKFEVIMKQDLEIQALTDVIMQEAFQTNYENYGMFILIIMTRGGSGGKLYGTDMKYVHRHEILKGLYVSETLKGKPKLVIMDAGDGDDLPIYAAKYQYDMAGPSLLNLTQISSPEDFIWLKSAMEGFASSKHSEFGSPFIRALVETLYKHAHQWDIKKIFKQIYMNFSPQL